MQVSSGVGCVAAVKNPPHPNAAKVFANWLLAKEGQDIFGKALGQGTRRLDVDTQWLSDIEVQAAKDFLRVEKYLKRESQQPPSQHSTFQPRPTRGGLLFCFQICFHTARD
jgi:ABC-type Fe3+ transport system substrate-binding protein